MVGGHASYRIHPGAHRLWEDCADVPHRLEEVVEELLRLPADQVQEGEIPMVAVKRRTLTGTVCGRRFMLIGERNRAKEWTTIFEVQPL